MKPTKLDVFKEWQVEYKTEDAETLVSEEIEKIKCGYYIE